ncbi:conjugal transfer protein TraG N-terminal domain-containing protein [Paenirhodobacter populi]|uniref:Conjugal transfer protein TraG n=1 Tax=Paenirhodobacter populi TaxID=2306993 RepID=A0A443JR33_9RHOB|nr:conjugal transfer protein TraG N-terminal domain-containing protein [Sinirhodobacter populi]RWR22946.1 hypothetical protein D2T30_04780 [Sinirhodobacter populi]
MQWEIYTTGGAYYLYDVFNFLAAYSGSGNFRNLLRIGIIVGIAWMCLQLAFGSSLGAAMRYALTMVIISMFALGPKSSVVIIDKTSGTIPIYGIVDNVPTAVAMLGHYTSGVSYYLTGQMETLMSTPTDLTYQQNGILFGSTLLAQAASWRAVSPKIHENLVNFMQQCAIDASNLGHMDLEMLATNGDLESFIGANMPASMAYYDVVTGQTRTCSAGWSDVRASVTSEVNAVLQQKAAGLYQGVNATGAANVARLQGTLGDFQNLMAMSSASAVSTIKQAMYVNSLDDGLMRFIATSGNSAAMDIYQVARADIQTRSSYAAIGVNAARWVPLLKIVFETLYYAAFPLAVLMMMTPLATTVLKGYTGGFVWIAAWEPLSAILHSIVIKASTGFYRQAGAVTTDGSVNDVVLSWANHFGIRAVEQDVGSVAGYLMMSVPFIATAILFGANRMVGMATSMLNVSQGAAIETGREAATGQISLGNMSMNNYAANKLNLSSVMDTGRETFTAPNGALLTRNYDGSHSWAGGTAVSSGGMTAQASQAVRSEISRRAEDSRTAASSAATELSDFIANSASDLTAFGRSVSNGTMASSSGTSDITTQSSRQVREAYNRIEDFARQHGISTELAMQAALTGAVGVGGNAGPINGSLGLSGQGKLGGTSSEQFTELAKWAHDAGLSKDAQHIFANRYSLGTSDSSGQQTSASEDRRYSLEEGQRLAETYISRLDEAQNYSEAASRIESAGVSMDANLNQMVGRELVERGMSPLDVGAVFNPQTPEEVRSSAAIIDSVVEKVVDDLVGAAPADPTAGFVMETDREAFRTAPARETTLGDGAVVSIEGEREKAAETDAAHREHVAGEGRDMYTGFEEHWEKEVVTNSDAELAGHADMDQTIGGAMMRRVFGWMNVEEDEGEALMRAHPEAWSSPGGAYDYYAAHPEKFQEVTGRPFVEGEAVPISPEMMGGGARGLPTPRVSMRSATGGEDPAADVSPPQTEMPAKAITPEERDILIRTVLGEAAGESNAGMAGVALVIRNRSDDQRFPASVGEVALQERQFSAWNEDGSGNDLVRNYNPGDPQYERAAYVVDVVMAGLVPDFTEGSTHYYSPAGMQALVEQGYQKNLIPSWLDRETARRDSLPVQVGGHVFTGKVQDE